VKYFVWAKMIALGLFFIIANSFAQADYPKKPITIIVPYAVGGGADQVALNWTTIKLALKAISSD
jgi:tripartite-type tricarboxylate transporter receptor subunit TctC